MLMVRLILTSAVSTAIFMALLFVPAWTLDWWRAWALLGVFIVASVPTVAVVLRSSPGLLRERMRPPIQKGQPLSDKLAVMALLVVYVAQLILIPLDVFRLHLLARPPTLVSSLGMVLIIVGWVVITLVYRENAFAAPVVKLQEERHHKVIDTGPYSLVRHPMYAGAALFMVGMALWLESYAGAIATVLPIGALVARIPIEERFLKRELPGYQEYVQRVRWRLMPHVW